MNCFGVLVVFAAAVAEMVSVADSEGSKAIQSQNSTNMEDARNSKCKILKLINFTFKL